MDKRSDVFSLGIVLFEALTGTFPHEGDTALRRHVNEIWSYYEWVAGQGVRQPLIERCFAWMDENWPDDSDTPVLLWGDARVGNVLYRVMTKLLGRVSESTRQRDA